MYQVKARKKPKFYQARWIVSNWLVSLARLIHPRNPEVEAFSMQLMMDQLIYGRSVVRVNPLEDL